MFIHQLGYTVSFRSFIQYASWPTACGVLVGIILLLLSNQSNNSTKYELGSSSTDILTNTLTNNNNSRPSFAAAVNNAAPAVVNIYTSKAPKRDHHPLQDDPLFRHYFNNSTVPQQERMQSTLGSGVIATADGYILTNHHVVEGADAIVVLLTDGREAEAQLIGSDPESDLAVLKIGLDNLTAIPIINSSDTQVGDVVLAIGNPFGVGQTVTQGIISATGRYGLGINTYENYLQTDAAINPGNSGGALIDAYGNLLGINTAILDKTGYSVGIGFAIPTNDALKVMNDLITHGKVVRGWLGIEAQQLSPQLAQSFNLDSTNGVVITAIYNDGPAHHAGLRPGDVITHINNQSVGDGHKGMNQIAETKPGETVSVAILRNGNPENVEVTIGIKPAAN